MRFQKYAHRPVPICSRYLIQTDIKIEEILGATETWNVDGNYELPSINPTQFDLFQWLNENKSITTCWLWSENNLKTSGRLISK